MCVCVHNTIHTAHVRDWQCFPHYCGNTQPWISSLINLGDTMCPHTGVQKAPVAYPCLVYYNATMKANKVSMYVCLYHHVNSTNHSLSYSGKLSGERTFANLTVLWLFTKVFSAKFGGVMSFGTAKVSNPRKFSLWKLYFSPIRKSLLPQKFPTIQYLYLRLVVWWVGYSWLGISYNDIHDWKVFLVT